MSWRAAWRAAGLALLLLCGACATKFEGAVDPAWFTRVMPPPEARAPGRVAVLVPPALRSQVHESTQGLARGVRLPLGRIVELALLTAAADAWRGGAMAVADVPPAGAGFAATLVVESVRVEHSDEVAWRHLAFIFGDRDVFSRLVIELSLRDAEGRPVWTHHYDGGRELLKRPSFWSSEPVPTGLTRMAHESAWRLSEQALGELREWQAVDRNQLRAF